MSRHGRQGRGGVSGRVGRLWGRWVVAAALLREHRAAYAGLFLVVAAASVLVGSEALLFQASRLSEVGDDLLAGMSPPRAVFFLGRVYSGHLSAVMLLVGGALGALVLVVQAVSVSVQGRRAELALLRLAGATPARVRAMVAREAFLLGLLASAVGAVVAVPGLRGLARLLASQSNWPEGLEPRVSVSGLVLTVVVMTGVSTVGALVGARGVARAAAVEAVRESSSTERGMSPVRWTVAAAGVLLVTWVLAVGPAGVPWDADDGVALWVAGGLAAGLCAVAPLLAGPGVWLACLPLRAVDKGAALTAWAHTRLAARRASAVAVSVAAAVILAVVPVMASSLGGARDFAADYALSDAVDAAVHHDTDQPDPALDAAWEEASSLPQAAAAVRAQTSSTSWMLAPEQVSPAQLIDQARRESFPLTTLGRHQITVTAASDPAALLEVAGPAVVEGSVADVGATGVAVRTDLTREDGTAYEVGDTITLLGADGQEVGVRVAALFESGYPLLTRLVADTSTLPPQAGEPVTEDWFLTAASGGRDQLLDSLAQAVPSPATVSTGQGWTDNVIDSETRRIASNDATQAGSICLLAASVMAQQSLALARSRRHETWVLGRAGASRATLLRAATAQTAGVQALGLVIGAVTIAATWAWLAYALVPYYADLTAPPPVPWHLLVASVLVAVIVPQAVTLAAASRGARPGPVRRG